MIILISGASHTGKTLLAQRLLEKYHYPYLSLDHLKMGLIRSGNTSLTPMDDDKMTDYLWPIARGMVKTAIENGQNLIIEGCYIPFDWRKDFDETYLPHIRALWLIMSEDYIRSHFFAIRDNANAIEARLDDSGLNTNELIRDNARNLAGCRTHGCEYFLMEEHYPALEEVISHDLSADPV
ncbi:MAG: AAA family ATPase [Oscillospiraceae bacterium]|nr:AAA family ATPase [Oscillospiraceae bacterium]